MVVKGERSRGVGILKILREFVEKIKNQKNKTKHLNPTIALKSECFLADLLLRRHKIQVYDLS